MRHTWRQHRAGLVAVRLEAEVPGAGWDRAGVEAGLVQLWLDGAHHQDVILVRGAERAIYERLLGELAAGDHEVEVRPAPPDAPARPPAQVHGVRVTPLEPRDQWEALAWREAPVLYTRAEPDPWESLWTDTPLAMFWRPAAGGVEFQCVFSHEDAGTDTRGLLAQWGRTTDIEWVLRLGADGPPTIQARGHHTLVHGGRRTLGRLTLQVVGLHGMVSDEPPRGAMRCLLLPRWRWDGPGPREGCMEPWMYRLMAQEVGRHGLLSPGSPAEDPRPGGLDQYLYVHVRRTDDALPPAAVEIRARLADGRVCGSAHGDARHAVARSWSFATAIKIPRGVTVAALEATALSPLPDGVHLQLERAFRLDAHMEPTPVFGAGESVVLAPGAPTAVLAGVGLPRR